MNLNAKVLRLNRSGTLKKRKGENPVNRIAFHSKKSIDFVSIENIIFLKAESNYTRIIMKNDEQHMVSRTLKSFEKAIRSTSFVRIHQSYIINIDYLQSIEQNIAVVANHQLPISRSRKNDTINSIKKKITFI